MNFWFISHNFLLSLSNCNALWSNVRHSTAQQVQVCARIDNLSVKFMVRLHNTTSLDSSFGHSCVTFLRCNSSSETQTKPGIIFHHRYTFDSVEPSRMKRKKNGSFKMRGKKHISHHHEAIFRQRSLRVQAAAAAECEITRDVLNVFCVQQHFFTFIMLPLSANQRWSDGNIAICSSIMSPHAVKHHHHITANYQAAFIRHYVIRVEEFVINHSPRSHDDN